MSKLRLDFQWCDGPGFSDPVFRHTLAELRILVDGKPVTRVFDGKARTTRDTVRVALYPLAEWLAARWWPLLEENRAVRRTTREQYDKRHDLRHADDGFAFPCLSIIPEGRRVLLEWKKRRFGTQQVEFLDEGSTYVSAPKVREVLADFIEAVLARLHTYGIEDTWLSSEWQATANADAEEEDFRTAAGRLGLDPYDLSDDMANGIIRVSQGLPGPACEELLRAASPENLLSDFAWVREGLAEVSRSSEAGGELDRVRSVIGKIQPSTPWQEGYELARRVRKGLDIVDLVPLQFGATWIHIPLIHATDAPRGDLDGVVGSSSGAPLCCYTHKRRQASSQFVLARGLAFFLEANGALPTVVSSAVAEKQQRSRAFAAELLCPAELIKADLSSDTVTQDELVDLAEKFEVSTYVIEHQIKNHRIAQIAESL